MRQSCMYRNDFWVNIMLFFGNVISCFRNVVHRWEICLLSCFKSTFFWGYNEKAHITFDYVKIRYCSSNTLTVSFRLHNYKEFHIRRSFQCNTLTKYDEEKQKMRNNVYLTKITLTWNVIPNTWWICNNIIVMAHSVGKFTVNKL